MASLERAGGGRLQAPGPQPAGFRELPVTAPAGARLAQTSRRLKSPLENGVSVRNGLVA